MGLLKDLNGDIHIFKRANLLPAGFFPMLGAVIFGNDTFCPFPCCLPSSKNGPCASPPPPAATRIG